ISALRGRCRRSRRFGLRPHSTASCSATAGGPAPSTSESRCRWRGGVSSSASNKTGPHGVPISTTAIRHPFSIRPTRVAPAAVEQVRERTETVARSRLTWRLAGSHPALELAQSELPDHQHAGRAVVEAGDGGEILAAVLLEDARVLDRDLLERFE